MTVLIVRPRDFHPTDWRDLPREFRIVSEMEHDNAPGLCEGFNRSELANPTGLWALTVKEGPTAEQSAINARAAAGTAAQKGKVRCDEPC